MALAAAVVGSDHFVGVVSVPVSLMNCCFCSRVPHELFVRQMTAFCLVGC